MLPIHHFRRFILPSYLRQLCFNLKLKYTINIQHTKKHCKKYENVIKI